MTRARNVVRFDPQRRAAGDALRTSVAALIVYLEAEEHRLDIRSRARRDEDRRNFGIAAEALACNLLITAMVSPKATLSVPRGHSTIWGNARYRNPVYGQHFLRLIDLLCELGFAKKITHGYRFSKTARQPTTIRPARSFKRLMQLSSLGPAAFRQDAAPELLILKPPKDHDGGAEPVDYKETKRTTQWRREIERLNTWLGDAPIGLMSESPAAFVLDDEGQPIESYRRSLRRIFNNEDWQQGGRLFGGFWMTMGRPARFRLLRIEDEPVVNVDFGSLFPRLAYARACEPQPAGDLYDISGDGSCREGWKQLINALLFSERPLRGWPRGTRENLSEGISLRQAISAIKTEHAPIASLFEQGLGFRLMRTESEMLIDVVTALFKQGIPALPLHDSVLVAQSQGKTAKKVMEVVFQQYTGSPRATVKIDFGPR